MGIYPIGSIVLLSDSSIGRVISVNQDAPLRPDIILLIDKDGKEFDGDSGPSINLLEAKKIFIVKALDLKQLLKQQRGAD